MITGPPFIKEHREKPSIKEKLAIAAKIPTNFNRQISILERGILYPVHMY